MDNREIEEAARDLQVRLWYKREELWPSETLLPFQLLEPQRAAKLLGVGFERYEELGSFGFKGQQFEVAGLIDRNTNKIVASLNFEPEVVRFTGAHEIGHFCMHPGLVMHRDRPIKGTVTETSPRPKEEREADHFAACFLVPRKLLVAAFEATFQCRRPLHLNDTTAYWLSSGNPESLLNAETGSLDFAVAVASARSYNGRRLYSLAAQFRVSVMTMAIRIRELGLIRE